MGIAQFSWHLFITCPKCDANIDLSDQDEDGWVSGPIFSNAWEKLEGEEVCCNQCGHEFTIDSVEY